MSGSALGLALLAVLAGCASSGDATLQDLPTASDMSEAERRARVRLELASAYFSRGQTATALDEVKLALNARPDLPEAFNLRGLIYGAMGEPRLAEDSFKRALQLAPRDGDALHNYAWFACMERRHDEAEDLFARALAVPQVPNAARTWLARGVCLGRAGRWQAAEQALSRAFELDPSSPSAGLHLSDALYRRGDFERARFYLRRVLQRPEASSASVLWLGVRVERMLGDAAGMRMLSEQLRERFPQSPEVLLLDKGRFDD